jgi:hypothetical protein
VAQRLAQAIWRRGNVLNIADIGSHIAHAGSS